MLIAAATAPAPDGQLHPFGPFPPTAPPEARSTSTHPGQQKRAAALERATSPAAPYQPPGRVSVSSGHAGLRQRTRIGTMSTPGHHPVARTSAFQTAGGAAAAAAAAQMAQPPQQNWAGMPSWPRLVSLRLSMNQTPAVSGLSPICTGGVAPPAISPIASGHMSDSGAADAAGAEASIQEQTAHTPSHHHARLDAIEQGAGRVLGVMEELLHGPAVPYLETMPPDAVRDVSPLAATESSSQQQQQRDGQLPEAASPTSMPLPRLEPLYPDQQVQWHVPVGAVQADTAAGQTEPCGHQTGIPSQRSSCPGITLDVPSGHAAHVDGAAEAAGQHAGHVALHVSPSNNITTTAAARAAQLSQLRASLQALVAGAGAGQQVDAMLQGTYNPDVPTELGLLAFEAQALGMPVMPLAALGSHHIAPPPQLSPHAPHSPPPLQQQPQQPQQPSRAPSLQRTTRASSLGLPSQLPCGAHACSTHAPPALTHEQVEAAVQAALAAEAAGTHELGAPAQHLQAVDHPGVVHSQMQGDSQAWTVSDTGHSGAGQLDSRSLHAVDAAGSTMVDATAIPPPAAATARQGSVLLPAEPTRRSDVQPAVPAPLGRGLHHVVPGQELSFADGLPAACDREMHDVRQIGDDDA